MHRNKTLQKCSFSPIGCSGEFQRDDSKQVCLNKSWPSRSALRHFLKMSKNLKLKFLKFKLFISLLPLRKFSKWTFCGKTLERNAFKCSFSPPCKAVARPGNCRKFLEMIQRKPVWESRSTLKNSIDQCTFPARFDNLAKTIGWGSKVCPNFFSAAELACHSNLGQKLANFWPFLTKNFSRSPCMPQFRAFSCWKCMLRAENLFKNLNSEACLRGRLALMVFRILKSVIFGLKPQHERPNFFKFFKNCNFPLREKSQKTWPRELVFPFNLNNNNNS